MKPNIESLRRPPPCQCGCRWAVHEKHNPAIHDPSGDLFAQYVKHNRIPASWLVPIHPDDLKHATHSTTAPQ